MRSLPGVSKNRSPMVPTKSLRAGRRWHACFLGVTLLAMILNASTPSVAEDIRKAVQNPTEYQVKAAFLYNFTRFIEWPSNVFPDPAEPILVGILGSNPFGDELERIFKSNTAGGRKMIVKRADELQDLRTCQILFISSSEKKHLARLLEKVDHARILTVSDMDSHGPLCLFTLVSRAVRISWLRWIRRSPCANRKYTSRQRV